MPNPWRIAAGFNCAAGGVVALFMVVHLGAVLVSRMHSGRAAGAPEAYLFGLPWDFRFYALLLFGGVGLASALMCLRSGMAMLAGDGVARRVAIRGSLLMVLVFAPLMPLQPIAVAVTLLAVVNAAVLWWSGRHGS